MPLLYDTKAVGISTQTWQKTHTMSKEHMKIAMIQMEVTIHLLMLFLSVFLQNIFMTLFKP